MKKPIPEGTRTVFLLATLAAGGIVAAGIAGAAPQQAAEQGFRWKDGAEVYSKVCAFCHETKIGPVIRGRGLDPLYISYTVRNGNRAMPAFRQSEIDDQSLQQVAEYVSTQASEK